MGGEFLTGMEDAAGAVYSSEYDLTRIIFGDVESVRMRLADAMEQMGYRTLNDNPLEARISSKGLGGSASSNNILDYQRTLRVSLKQVGQNSTRAIFDYTVKYTYLVKGDKQTLAREVDAIIALAASQATGRCPSCGSVTTSGSRFCRQCGAPTATFPVEMELLRATAHTNAGNKSIVGGTFFMVFAMLLPLLLFFINPDPIKFAKAVKIITILSGVLGATGLSMIINGLFHFRRVLLPREESALTPGFAPRSLKVPDTSSLPGESSAVPLPSSVTEATTDLLKKS